MDKCFPCIDLCRLAALHPHFAEMLALGEAEGSGGLLKAVADKLAQGKDLVREHTVATKNNFPSGEGFGERTLRMLIKHTAVTKSLSHHTYMR